MSIPELPLLKATADLLSEVTGKPCGVMRTPRVEDIDRVGNQTKPVEPPYMAVYPIPGGLVMGPAYGDEGSVQTVIVQVSCVAKRGDDAVWMRDRARHTMLDLTDTGGPVHALTVPGLVVMRRTLDGQGTPMDDKGLVTAALRVALHVATADTP